MLTPFGKAIRKMRIDRGLMLKDMATAVGLSSAFLSSVETGRKPIPDDLVTKISGAFELNSNTRDELLAAAAESKSDYKISLGEHPTATDRNVAAMLARQFRSLTDDDKDTIRRLLERKRA